MDEQGGDAPHIVPTLAKKRADFSVTITPAGSDTSLRLELVAATDRTALPADLAQAEGDVVVVDKVHAGADSAVHVGDVLRAVNEKPVRSVDEARALLVGVSGPVRLALTRVEHHHHHHHPHHHHHHHQQSQNHAGAGEGEGEGETPERVRQFRRTAGQLGGDAKWELQRRASDPHIGGGATTPVLGNADAAGCETPTNNLQGTASVAEEAEASDTVSSMLKSFVGKVGLDGSRRESMDSSLSAFTDSDSEDLSGQETILEVAVSESKWSRLKRAYQRYRVFRRRGYPWVQLAGHAEGFKQDASSPDWILKLGSDNEKAAFLTLADVPELKGFVPDFGGIQEADGKEYLQLQNLLNGFSDAAVMDCKIGIRTFLEKEASGGGPRKDLLQKMEKIDGTLLTEEEKANGITKLRYMTFRDEQSSSASLGFRIEAQRLIGGESTKEFKVCREREDVARYFRRYVGDREDVRKIFIEKLNAFEAALKASPFFSTHEIIGSSLLFVYDQKANHAGVWMIDFGKTVKRNAVIQHDVAWVQGSGGYEDGYLIGLRNIVSILHSLANPSN